MSRGAVATRVVRIDPDPPESGPLAEAAATLRSGGLVAFATETVYGLGADATNPEAVARIFAAKGRPATNPLIVHVDRKETAFPLVARWTAEADLLADRFWPGPLSLVLPRSGLIPDNVTAGQGTVGLRVPRHLVARTLIERAGCPIAAPSANRSTGVSPTRAEHVWGDLAGKVDLILDSGPTAVGIESTVLDLSGPSPRVLRPGSITAEQIAEALGRPVSSASHAADASSPMSSPGQMDVHYAPRTPAFRVEGERFDRLPPGSGSYQRISIGPPDRRWPADPTRESEHVGLSDPGQAAEMLYRLLHDVDRTKPTFLLIVMPPDLPEWRAIRDRVRRATRPWDGRAPLP
ncbi:L-threonylcarbamoyladenylate synthase [Tundrisphaera sp. TA3]|uniref:L-threonylcarbamoyladenylate synthase n=1 Tax=Tundrisphaera sp. TA3 TaxID=3435775 RepID=UPI003EC00031